MSSLRSDGNVPAYAIDHRREWFETEQELAIVRALQSLPGRRCDDGLNGDARGLQEKYASIKSAWVGSDCWRGSLLETLEEIRASMKLLETGLPGEAVHVHPRDRIVHKALKHDYDTLCKSMVELDNEIARILDTQFILIKPDVLQENRDTVGFAGQIRSAPPPSLELLENGTYDLSSQEEKAARQTGRFLDRPFLWCDEEQVSSQRVGIYSSLARSHQSVSGPRGPNTGVIDLLDSIKEGLTGRSSDAVHVRRVLAEAANQAPSLLSVDVGEHNATQTSTTRSDREALLAHMASLRIENRLSIGPRS